MKSAGVCLLFGLCACGASSPEPPSPAKAETVTQEATALQDATPQAAAPLNADVVTPGGPRFKNAFEAYQRGDYQAAFQALPALANSGNAEAQYLLSHMYAVGQGTERNEAEAAQWCRKAAEQGLVDAQFSLAVLLANGRGVTKDPGEAAQWFRKAAEQGHLDAQYSLGKKYSLGQGVPKDPNLAALWFRRAAEGGLAIAQLQFGLAYSIGEGVPKDYVQAYKWISLAQSRLAADQSKTRQTAQQILDGLSSAMPPSQIEEAKKQASQWKPNLKKED